MIRFNFNPANPQSHRKIKIEPTKSKIYPYAQVMLCLNPNHEYGHHTMDKETGEWFIYDKTAHKIVRDIGLEITTKRQCV